ncbi:16S rRNA (cytidine(1402)-2'-O)-methyltransferase [Methylophaga sp. OBS3]|uniref:16S rRNA (cytidine(1402)-2'-O)-methyltransferase n=1 Tax=Methylophaga sp. OBS3 TaxID=2991934 RepID=UPI002258F709|nr:16S rRNA (cytidine(1402)-2'-O)-methyltransferase [Methylophaga sp. OBS3]MCX4190347.1 16S rRNA (cytidine(1402)-2'-O)-methyltransferase [Methylophaga sp. OBS3]
MSVTEPGHLYIVATPIGNLGDMSTRAVETLKEVDLIAAEDTRHSKYLLDLHLISTPSISLHDHNEQQRSQLLLEKLQEGQSIALISDAGTPLISDPGYKLVTLVRSAGIKVIPIPGSCAFIAALSASGLPSDRFAFEGFLPPKSGARQQKLQILAEDTRTLIFYESPKRVAATLNEMQQIFGADRQACIARELTKIHETIETRPLAELAEWVAADNNQQKGEIVLLVAGAVDGMSADEQAMQRMLNLLLPEMPVKKAATITAEWLSVSKNAAYQLALKLQQK